MPDFTSPIPDDDALPALIEEYAKREALASVLTYTDDIEFDSFADYLSENLRSYPDNDLYSVWEPFADYTCDTLLATLLGMQESLRAFAAGVMRLTNTQFSSAENGEHHV